MSISNPRYQAFSPIFHEFSLMLIVGLTGGIATGKSTVSVTLREKYNLTVVDADVIARQVVDPGTRAYGKILEAFSQDVPDLINADLSLNRAALGRAVFGHKDRLRKLNSIVHPAVRREIFWQVFKAYISFKELVILDVPLLFESGLHRFCGVVVTVSCERPLQVERLMIRNPELTEEDANNRIDSQMSNEERNYRADIVIDNGKSLNELKSAVGSVVAEIRPWKLFTVLDYLPPLGILSAVYTFAVRQMRDFYKGTKKSD